MLKVEKWLHLGSSGAGKTPLLNILAGRVTDGKIEGTVKLNRRRDKKLDETKQTTNYVSL